MPSGRTTSPEIKRAALKQYYSGERTVKQICADTGIALRTIYDWIEAQGHGARMHNAKAPRRNLRISTEETELLLLILAECDKIMTPKQKAIARPLEDRLLDIADELYEMTERREL